MIYDPIQAALTGLTTSLVRIGLAILVFGIALASYLIGQREISFWLASMYPLVALGVIFAWATSVPLFFIGVTLLVLLFIATWRFTETANPKGVLVLIYILSFLYLFPLSRREDFDTWMWIAVASTTLNIYFIAAYVLPFFQRRSAL